MARTSTEAPARHRLGEIPEIGPAAIAIGVFDGVHVGHQSLAASVRAAAERLGARAVMIVIDPHPNEVFDAAAPVARLTSVPRTTGLLSECGVDDVVVLAFDRDVAALAPDEFLRALAPGIRVRAVVMTEESRFGRARSGTADVVREIGERDGFGVTVVPLVEMQGARVSSTGLREAVARGDLRLAQDLLGRPHAVDGTVSVATHTGPGTRLALTPGYHAAMPPPGEYRTRVAWSADLAGEGGESRAYVERDRVLFGVPADTLIPTGEARITFV